MQTNSSESIPIWARAYLTTQDLSKIEDAVEKAERNTSGEIVVRMVRQSTPTRIVPWLVFAIFAALAEAFFSSGFAIAGCTMLLFGAFCARPVSNWPWVQRILTHKSDRNLCVVRRADMEFMLHCSGKTKSSTGFFIFFSLMEREVVVLAERGIVAKLPSPMWDKICQVILTGARSNSLASGIEQGINEAADILAKNYPREAEDSNELPNRMIISE